MQKQLPFCRAQKEQNVPYRFFKPFEFNSTGNNRLISCNRTPDAHVCAFGVVAQGLKFQKREFIILPDVSCLVYMPKKKVSNDVAAF